MKPLQPEHFVYQGFFRLPDRRGRPPWEKFSWGGHAMAYCVERDSLFVAGHEHHDLVAEINVALPDKEGRTRSFVLSSSRRSDFFDPAPFRTIAERKRLDTLGGLELEADGSVLYSTWHAFYGVQPTDELDIATLAAFDLEENRSVVGHFGVIGPRKEPFSQKAHSGYAFRIPYEWTTENGIEGQVLACGRGDGAGNATSPKGPALFAVDPHQPERATVLLYRATGQEPPGWTPCDKWHGGAWIRAGEYEAVVFVGEVAVEPTWYGAPDMPDERPEWFSPPYVGEDALEWNNDAEWRGRWRDHGIRDTWRPGRGGKGYHTTRREVRLQAYDAGEFAAIVERPDLGAGAVPAWNHALNVFHEAANPRACAYDEAGRRFFVWEHWPPATGPDGYEGEDPRIHVWRVEVPDDASEPEPEPEERVYRVDYPDGRHGEYADTDAGKLMLIRQVTRVNE